MTRAGLILALYGSLALIAILVSAARGDVDIYRIEGVSTPLLMALSPVIGIALGLAVVFLSRLAVHRFDWARRLHNDFRQILGKLSYKEILVLAVASSVGEELLFRGALQPIVGVWAQAIVFALLHIGPGPGKKWAGAQIFAVARDGVPGSGTSKRAMKCRFR